MTKGQRIAELRSLKQESQSELAKAIHVSPSTIGMWETDQRSIKDDDLSKLSDHFDVSTDYLLGKTSKKHYYDLTHKEKVDLGKLADELLEGSTSDAESDFYGEPSTDEQKASLRAAILTALEMNKKKAKKKFTPKKYRDSDN